MPTPLSQSLRLLLFAALVAFCNLAPRAQGQTLKQLLGDTRADNVFITTPASQRLDMIDYYESGMDNTVASALGGSAKITSLTDSLCSITYTTGGQVVVALLPGVEPRVLCIDTYSLPQPDSRVRVFNTRWEPVSQPFKPAPGLSQWLTPLGKKQRDDVETGLPFILAQATYNPTDGTLHMVHTMKEYYGPDAPAELGLIVPEVVYHWNGKQFVK